MNSYGNKKIARSKKRKICILIQIILLITIITIDILSKIYNIHNIVLSNISVYCPILVCILAIIASKEDKKENNIS